MNKGDRIQWSYKHSLNRKSFTWITKVGIFIKTRAIGSHVKVHFDGNKHPSIVPLREIKLVELTQTR